LVGVEKKRDKATVSTGAGRAVETMRGRKKEREKGKPTANNGLVKTRRTKRGKNRVWKGELKASPSQRQEFSQGKTRTLFFRTVDKNGRKLKACSSRIVGHHQ